MTITGLSEGVIYSIRLKAISVVGQGVASSAISVTPLTVTAPAAPTNLSAKSGGQNVKISFTPGSSNGASITNYAFRLGEADYIDLDPADSISPVTITGLSEVTTYTVRLKAINARGRSPASEALTFTTTQGFETGIHSLVPGTSCKAADPGNSIKLQSREQGLTNTETEDALSVICPVALPFTDAIEVIGDTRFSITMYARQGEGGDTETTEMSCTLDRYEGQTLLSSQPVQVPLQLETQSSGAVGESLTVSYLGSFSITCDLPPQTAITSIETRTIY